MCIYVWGSVTVGVVHGEIPFFDKTLRINVVPIIGERVRESKRQGGLHKFYMGEPLLWLSLSACRRREMQAGNESRKTPDFLYVPEAITEKALLLPLYNEAAGVPGVCVRQE